MQPKTQIARSRRSYGKVEDCEQSNYGFSEDVVVTETRCQMLEVLIFCDRKVDQPPSINMSVLTSLVKRVKNEAFRVSIF